MERPRDPTSATDRIDWREARYLARVVQLLVTSRTDKAEFELYNEKVIDPVMPLKSFVASSAALTAAESVPSARFTAVDPQAPLPGPQGAVFPGLDLVAVITTTNLPRARRPRPRRPDPDRARARLGRTLAGC